MSVPRAYVSYTIALMGVMGVAFDVAGLPPRHPLHTAPLAVAVIGVVALVEVVLLPSRWAEHGWRALLPLTACVVSPFLGSALGHGLFHARFLLTRDRYEAVATGIRDRTYRLPLHEEDRDLGYYGADFRMVGDDVVAVEFWSVTHGYAGHKAVARVFDNRLYDPLDQWRIRHPLTEGWIIVGD